MVSTPATAAQHAKTSVLVVDNDFHTCQLLKRTLEQAGYETAVYSDPYAVDPKNAAWHYQIAILDFEMPGLTGIDLFKRIRKYDPLIDAIILTGQAEYEDAVAGYRVGIAAWVTKPWSREGLLNEISRVLLRRQTLLKRLNDEFKTLDFASIGARLRATENIANSTRDQIRTLRQRRD